MNTYVPIIGLEVHVELKTKRKMFCDCPSFYFGKEPNIQTCPVCLGLPGALPVPNKKAIDWTILIGKALNCKINRVSKFDRKHYFYPDLPKGYQISQYDEPLSRSGKLTMNGKQFGITRVHLEEDTGKLLHVGDETLIDFNRSGVPLVEIVTEPDFNNSDDVKRFLEKLQDIIRSQQVSDADMEKGSMRIEPNISVKLETRNSKLETGLPPYKVEVKNINSFRYVKQAIDYEIKRQTEILEKGETPIQETRGFDEKKVVTYSQRTKEEAHDYRYFPEPDIPPMVFSQEYVDSISVRQLPQEKEDRYVKKGIKLQDASTLARDITASEYLDSVLNASGADIEPQSIANLIINKKLPLTLPVSEFIKRANELKTPKTTDARLLESSVSKVLRANKKAAEDFKNGKENAIMFLVGQVMREMEGKADAKKVREVLIRTLSS